MSENEKQSENTINNQQIEEVDYADPESPTLAIRRLTSPTTGPKERQTDIVETNNVDMAGTVLPVPHRPQQQKRHLRHLLRRQPNNDIHGTLHF